MSARIIVGDCVEAMAAMDPASVDAICTDPPYGLRFMGKAWDSTFNPQTLPTRVGEREGTGPPSDALDGRSKGRTKSAFANPSGLAGAYDFSSAGNRSFQTWCEAWATEALRVLKPGGHLLAFGGTRTSHRLACAIEDAGFEIRDTIAWMYGSGFPKSLSVPKAIETEARPLVKAWLGPHGSATSNAAMDAAHEEIARRAAIQQTHNGDGTALKPSYEPIVVARKPLNGTVAATVLRHGTGALNVDGCRVGTDAQHKAKCESVIGLDSNRNGVAYGEWTGERESSWTPAGRWPANVCLDEEAARLLDQQTGTLTTHPGTMRSDSGGGGYGSLPNRPIGATLSAGDSGGASRFFYVAKASSAERNAGLEGFEIRGTTADGYGSIQTPTLDRSAPRENWTPHPVRNVHPTVKPIALMRWLVRLVTPPGGTVLDPFAGSGTTGCAAALEGFEFVGIEREAEYAAIAEARIAWWSEHPNGMTLVRRLELEKERTAKADSGQGSIFDVLGGEAA